MSVMPRWLGMKLSICYLLVAYVTSETEGQKPTMKP